jgi:3-dehydroquinate dehydratase-2
MTRFLILNGPNINILGRRDPQIYGSKTLEEINREVAERAASLGIEVAFYQSNVEGHLIDCIQENWGRIQGIIVNPGALTHYSYALKDALSDAGVPVIEVHLSNTYAREAWRRHSVIADIAVGQIAGFGWRSYTAALDILAALVKEEAPK